MKKNAVVKFLNKDEGGRYFPPSAGYKPQLKIDEEFTSCFITPKDASVGTMNFGVEHDVFLELQFEDLYFKKIKKNMDIKLYEGNKLIGVGYFTD